MKDGDHIIYTAALGVLRTEHSTKFYDAVQKGETGRYLRPHPTLGNEDWHLTQPDRFPDGLVPVHLSQIRRATEQ